MRQYGLHGERAVHIAAILIVLAASTMFAGCLEENPMDMVIDKAAEETHEKVDPYKRDYEDPLKTLEKVVQEQSEKLEDKISASDVIVDSNGEMDTSASLCPEGHAVLFPIDKKMIIDEIDIYSCRYDDASRMFDIEIWDSDFNTLYSTSYDYTDYFPDSHTPPSDGGFKWVTINIPNIEVDDDFYVSLFTYSGHPSWVKDDGYDGIYGGGIEIGVDRDKESGNSFVVEKNPNRIADWPTWNLQQDKTDWMIRMSGKYD